MLFWYTCFSFFEIIGLYFVMPVAILQVFNPLAELVIPIRISSKKANAEIKIHPVIAEIEIKKFSI